MSGRGYLRAEGVYKGGDRPCSSFVFPSTLFDSKSALKSCRQCRLRTLVSVLWHTGLRVSEAFRIKQTHLLPITLLEVLPSKNSRNRRIELPEEFWHHLVYLFRYCRGFQGITYAQVYTYCCSLYRGEEIFSFGKNRAITHFFRKRLIHFLFFEERWSADRVIKFFGWKARTSLIYYL